MVNLFIWGVLGAISIILLIVFWKTKNAVWGGLILGIIIGFIITIISFFMGNGFGLLVVGKSAIMGTILGFIAELLGKLSDYLKNKE